MTSEDTEVSSGRSFEVLARSVCATAWGVELDSAVVEVARGYSHQFDLVSPDQSIVGDAKWYRNLKTPAAKWSTIAEYVWLLQHLPETTRKVMVFGQDREVPVRWLHRHRPLVEDVEFYFLSTSQALELLA